MDGGEDDDRQMAAVARGDRAAFGALVDRHYAALFRLAARLTGDPELARDLTQTAFLKILEAADRYRAEGRFPAYARAVLTRLAIDAARRHEPEAELDPDSPRLASGEPGPAARVEAAETARELARALLDLPAAQRAALVLRAHEGLSYQAIAEVLETSEKAVEMLLRRAREALLATRSRAHPT